MVDEPKPVAWTNAANIRVLKNPEPLMHATMYPENTAHWNVPLYPASVLTALQEQVAAVLTNRAEVAEYKLQQAVGETQPMIIHRAEAAEARVRELEAALKRARPFVEFAIVDGSILDLSEEEENQTLDAIDAALSNQGEG